MIEFTLSRVSLIICGVAILAAVLIPVQSMYDNRYDDSVTNIADKTSFILDEFWASEADTMTLRGWEILPSAGSSMEINGHSLIIYHNNSSYSSLISQKMEYLTLGFEDEITIVKDSAF